jgi:hypothetical protein
VVADSDTEWRGRVEGAEPGKLHNKYRLYSLFKLINLPRKILVCIKFFAVFTPMWQLVIYVISKERAGIPSSMGAA